jgi:hypothetical protein
VGTAINSTELYGPGATSNGWVVSAPAPGAGSSTGTGIEDAPNRAGPPPARVAQTAAPSGAPGVAS